MPHEAKNPTYHRLLSAFKAIGPYLREDKCQAECYFFDCLSVCVNDQKAPEKREFWGWWMVLSVEEGSYQACYKYGRYDQNGDWVEDELKTANQEEVERTRIVFHEKLVTMLDKDFSIHINLNECDLVCD